MWPIIMLLGSQSVDVAQDRLALDPSTTNLAYRLHVASGTASASHDCPSRRQRRYARDFERRYGDRIKRLIALHTALAGKDPDADFVVISSCRMPLRSTSSGRQDADHRKAMNGFEPQLQALEKEFGSE